MPELPEVETIARSLQPVLPGCRFDSISTTHGPAVDPSPAYFEKIKGKAVTKVSRRGKFLLIHFENDFVMTIHLRMSGRILVMEHDDPELRFERTRIEFDRCSMRFCDQRKFGKTWLSPVDDYETHTGIFRLGIEPFDPDCTFEKFSQLMERKRGPIKKHLLDQSLVTGVGNIYADEACFYAGLRPDTAIESLDKAELESLFHSVIKALQQGIENKGTSISDYADAYGKMGTNQELLYVYGRKGKPCMKCDAVLTGIRLVGRGTVYCEKCQK